MNLPPSGDQAMIFVEALAAALHQYRGQRTPLKDCTSCAEMAIALSAALPEFDRVLAAARDVDACLRPKPVTEGGMLVAPGKGRAFELAAARLHDALHGGKP